jgi:hypothetical protein
MYYKKIYYYIVFSMIFANVVRGSSSMSLLLFVVVDVDVGGFVDFSLSRVESSRAIRASVESTSLESSSSFPSTTRGNNNNNIAALESKVVKIGCLLFVFVRLAPVSGAFFGVAVGAVVLLLLVGGLSEVGVDD